MVFFVSQYYNCTRNLELRTVFTVSAFYRKCFLLYFNNIVKYKQYLMGVSNIDVMRYYMYNAVRYHMR